MKKTLLFLFLQFILLLVISAQDFQKSIVMGVDMSYVINSQRQYKSDPLVGGNINFRLSRENERLIGTSIEPGFIRKGGDFEYLIGEKILFTYAHLPMMLDFHVSKKFTLYTGLEYAYMIKAKNSDVTATNIAFHYNRAEISGLAGIRFNLDEKVALNLRVNHGISPTKIIPITNEFGEKIGKLSFYNAYGQFSLIIGL